MKLKQPTTEPNSQADCGQSTFATTLIGASLLCLTLSSGCASMRHWMSFSPQASEPCVLAPDATAAEIVNTLNDNISKLYAWRSTDVRITARQGGVPMTLSAVMAVESPRKLRLRVSSLTGYEVDLGSNPERFWFWMKRGDPHGIMTASYDDVADGKPMGPLPFQPDWLIEALGVIPITAADFIMHDQPIDPRNGQKARHVAFVGEQITPQGRAIKRTMIVDACHGVIVEHSLRETSGRLIARAGLSNYQREFNGVRLPHRIDLTWPDSGVELTLRIGSIETNPNAVSEETWAMPTYPDSPVIDLTRFRP
ncbi:MAG: hypothetical protein NT013_20610 [Planctomycetia bacterium]|nr:hypothetical protein [Planctomycetia bacterium]